MVTVTNEAVIEKICNAANLSTAQRYAKENGIEFKLCSQTEEDITYSLMINGEATTLDYCSTCKRALVDTSYCDGCDSDEEDDFNRGEWF